jgi:hypothetical protein
MKEILTEFEKKIVRNAKNKLEEVIKSLSSLNEMANVQEKIEIAKSITSIKEKEKYVYNILNKEIETDFAIKNKNELERISKKQENVRKRTKNIENALTQFPQFKDVSYNMSNAIEYMKKSEEALSTANTNLALENETNALSYLLKSLENIELQIQHSEEIPFFGFIKPREGKYEGILGSRTGYVSIPSPELYRPPKEFREEIIEAMKEKFPKLYEDIIKKYYKNLIQ